MRPRHAIPPGAIVALAALVVSATPVLAGPPLLCHPFDIGGARSLPWGGTTWMGSAPGYQLTALVEDTKAILTPATPVVVRMETLRRAAIYSSRDPQVAAALFKALVVRASQAEATGRPDRLAYLDAAYFTEALRQLSRLDESPLVADGRASMLRAIVQGTDGYSLVLKAVAVEPGDGAMQFAAALIAMDGHHDAVGAHARKARAGATNDGLLARNIDKVR